MTGTSVNPLGQLVSLLFVLLFVLLDGPQTIVVGLARSFVALPLGAANLAAGGPVLLSWTGGFFSTAVGHSVGHASGIGAQSNSHVNAHAGGSVAESTSNAKSLFGDVSTSNDAKAIGRRGESPV